jgi:glutamyl/glutaminyl-tRNA synthetase
LHPRTEVLSEIPEKIDFLEVLPEYSIELYINKKMKTDYTNSLDSLKASKEILITLNKWDYQNIHECLIALVNKLSVKNGQLLWPLRIAVSGKEVTPGGAVELIELLGKNETLHRIEVGISKLSALKEMISK